MTKGKRITLYIIRSIFIAFAIFFLVWILVDPNYNKWGGVISGIGLPFVPLVVGKLFKVKIPFRIQLIYYAFLFIALDLGICFDWYKNIPYYDKVVHFGSGALSAIVGYYLIVFFKAQKTPKVFRGLFIVFTCIAIGVAWEFFEFACDKFLGQSMQQLVSPGVDDTMFDLLCAAVGGTLGAIIFTRPSFIKSIEKE